MIYAHITLQRPLKFSPNKKEKYKSLLSFICTYLFLSPLFNIHVSRLTSSTEPTILCNELWNFIWVLWHNTLWRNRKLPLSCSPVFLLFYRYPLMFYYLTILTLKTLKIISTILIIFLQPRCHFKGMRVYSFSSSVCSYSRIHGEFHKINPMGFKIYI